MCQWLLKQSPGPKNYAARPVFEISGSATTTTPLFKEKKKKKAVNKEFLLTCNKSL